MNNGPTRPSLVLPIRNSNALRRKRIFICYEEAEISASQRLELKEGIPDCTLDVYEMKVTTETISKEKEKADEEETQKIFSSGGKADLFVAFVSKNSLQTVMTLGLLTRSPGPVLALAMDKVAFSKLRRFRHGDLWRNLSVEFYETIPKAVEYIKGRLYRVGQSPPLLAQENIEVGTPPIVASEKSSPIVEDTVK